MQNIPANSKTHLLDRTSRSCPTCGASNDQAIRFLEERIDASRLNNFSFASRKEPEFLNYGMLCCEKCGTVYVNTPPSQNALERAYHDAAYDSAEEANDAAASYLRELEPVLTRIQMNSALEIGSGTGVLLDKLLDRGFSTVHGVEPSVAAIKSASPRIRGMIREGIFCESLYDSQSFDLVCCFMTLEHVAAPMDIAKSAYRLLKPGGAFVTVTHDYRSFVNRLMGRRSPIIDIEHMQLFSEKSIATLYSLAGYSDINVRAFSNTYAASYWLKLMPMPIEFKRIIRQILNLMALDRIKLTTNVGNTFTYGFRPVDSTGAFK